MWFLDQKTIKHCLPNIGNRLATSQTLAWKQNSFSNVFEKLKKLLCFSSMLVSNKNVWRAVWRAILCYVAKRSNIVRQTFETFLSSNVWTFDHVVKNFFESKTKLNLLLDAIWKIQKHVWQAMFCDVVKRKAFCLSITISHVWQTINSLVKHLHLWRNTD